MSYRNNKKTGNDFEREFRLLLRDHGYWSHKLVENENGAPFDILAVKNGRPFAFDCKECSSARFPLSRVEDNQITGMKSIVSAGAEGFFAFRLNGVITLASSPHILHLMHEGEKSVDVTGFSGLEGWLLWH